MLHKIKYQIVVFLVAVLAVACNPKGEEPSPDLLGANHTALVYMMAENSLSVPYQFDKTNIEAMCRAVENNDIKGRLMIFYAGYDGSPSLLEIKKDRASGSRIDTLKVYEGSVSTDTATMSLVLRDVQRIAQSDSYGMIVWTHANGWLPQYRYYKSPPKQAPASVGCEGDEGRTMDVDMMAQALQPFHLDYIIFDACLMGCVEVMYELREVCDYIIAAPTEMLGEGLPYEEIIPLLYAEERDYEQICRAYYNKYIVEERCGTIALVATAHMDALSEACRKIVAHKDEEIAQITPAMLQYYDRKLPHVYYDLGQYMRMLANDDDYAHFESILDKAVPYKACSSTFLTIKIRHYSGLSSYVPGISGDEVVEEYYRTLQWYDRVYK